MSNRLRRYTPSAPRSDLRLPPSRYALRRTSRLVRRGASAAPCRARHARRTRKPAYAGREHALTGFTKENYSIGNLRLLIFVYVRGHAKRTGLKFTKSNVTLYIKVRKWYHTLNLTKDGDGNVYYYVIKGPGYNTC